MDTFGSRLREARLRKHLLQRELGDMLGFSQNAISSYERGLNDPSFFAATCIADALDVSLDWLACRKDTMK